MLKEEDWKAIDAMVDGEYTVQVEDALWEAVLVGVRLALDVINGREAHEQALRYLMKFANWEHLNLSSNDLHQIRVWNYGEAETAAIEKEEGTNGGPGNATG